MSPGTLADSTSSMTTSITTPVDLLLSSQLFLAGSWASPYTRKVYAYLRYRNIPFKFLRKGNDSPQYAGKYGVCKDMQKQGHPDPPGPELQPNVILDFGFFRRDGSNGTSHESHNENVLGVSDLEAAPFLDLVGKAYGVKAGKTVVGIRRTGLKTGVNRDDKDNTETRITAISLVDSTYMLEAFELCLFGENFAQSPMKLPSNTNTAHRIQPNLNPNSYLLSHPQAQPFAQNNSPIHRFIDFFLEDFFDEWGTKLMFYYRWGAAFEKEREEGEKTLKKTLSNQESDPDTSNPVTDNPVTSVADNNTIHFISNLLVSSLDWTLPKPQLEATAQFFAERQIERLGIVGCRNTEGISKKTDSNTPSSNTSLSSSNTSLISLSYTSILEILDDLLSSGENAFLLGPFPSRCDFALHGQFVQLLTIDPISQDIGRKFPRVVSWVGALQDLSGYSYAAKEERPSTEDGENLKGLSSKDLEDVPNSGKTRRTDKLRDLLLLIESIYVPFLLANEKCIQEKEKSFTVGISTGKWISAGKLTKLTGHQGNEHDRNASVKSDVVLDFRQKPFKYQMKCLQKLRKEAAPALSAAKAIGASKAAADSSLDSDTVATIGEICWGLINGGQKKGKL